MKITRKTRRVAPALVGHSIPSTDSWDTNSRKPIILDDTGSVVWEGRDTGWWGRGGGGGAVGHPALELPTVVNSIKEKGTI